MAIPDRSTLPPEFLELLAWQTENVGTRYGDKPILPADETPDELVEAAKLFRDLLDDFLETGSLTAVEFDSYYRQVLNDVIDRKLTEPIDVRVPADLKYFPDFEAREGLGSAYINFDSLLRGSDHSSKASMSIIRKATIMQRKAKAAELGMELELTDDEWFDIQRPQGRQQNAEPTDQ